MATSPDMRPDPLQQINDLYDQIASYETALRAIASGNDLVGNPYNRNQMIDIARDVLPERAMPIQVADLLRDVDALPAPARVTKATPTNTLPLPDGVSPEAAFWYRANSHADMNAGQKLVFKRDFIIWADKNPEAAKKYGEEGYFNFRSDKQRQYSAGKPKKGATLNV